MLNFKKGSIFDRSAKAQEDFMDEPGNQVLAVWGSPGSGKSTVAVKLAKYLVGKKRNVVLLTCDMTAPMLPCICPPADLECEHSLGSVLAAAQVTQSLVRHNCTDGIRCGSPPGKLRFEEYQLSFQPAAPAAGQQMGCG